MTNAGHGAVLVTVDSLTRREIEVLKLIGDGLSTKKIANSLGIASRTVACHRQHALWKLGGKNNMGAVREAIRRGIIEL